MSNIGDRFKTGTKCTTSGSYVFNGYTDTDDTNIPDPTQNERVISLTRGETFPPIKSQDKGAWWKLQRIA